jgi:hypothetical protein
MQVNPAKPLLSAQSPLSKIAAPASPVPGRVLGGCAIYSGQGRKGQSFWIIAEHGHQAGTPPQHPARPAGPGAAADRAALTAGCRAWPRAPPTTPSPASARSSPGTTLCVTPDQQECYYCDIRFSGGEEKETADDG